LLIAPVRRAEHGDTEVGEVLRMFENAGKAVGVI
jgi:hypothetical protein